MDLMTGSELYDYIVRTFKRTDKETEIYEAITDTILDLQVRFGFDAQKVEAYTTAGITALGDYKLDLPDDFGSIVGDVRFADGNASWGLQKRSKLEFNERFPDPDDDDAITGQPTDYCIFGKQILLGPVPDRTDYIYQLDYTTVLADPVTSASASVSFSDVGRECLRYGALGRLYDALEEDALATKNYTLYEKEFQKLKKRDLQNVQEVFTVKQVEV